MFNEKILDNMEFSQEAKMTVNGTMNKTLVLMLVTTVTAIFSWKQMLLLGTSLYPALFATMILGIILVVVGMKKPQYAYIIAPSYAFIEGLFVGAISAIYGSMFDGIVMNAVLLTLGTLISMLFIYKAGIIKVTNKFKMIMGMAIGAIGVLYLTSWILGFMGINVAFLHSNSPLSIGISIVITAVAALTLLLDFDMIDNNVKKGASKDFEWVGAMALLVTIVWLYLEFLRLLSKLQD